MNTDEYYMKEAIAVGKEALANEEVPVGCVVIDEHGNIVAKGRNHTKEYQDGTQHAELLCIDQLLKQNINMKRCILYVTCEPCIMCAEALRQCGINKIIYGCSNPRFGGCGSILSIIPSVCYPFSHQHQHENENQNQNQNLNQNEIRHQFDETNAFCYHSFMEQEGLQLLQQFFALGNESAPEELRKKRKD